MVIRAYLFTNMARQINDYGVESFTLNESFIYEVEVYPETIFICSDKYLQARKYKIVRYISVFEYLNEIDLPGIF